MDFGAVPPDARECETSYAERADGALAPLVKRWCVGVPGAFFGFGDWFAAPMDSLGAAYSHVSHVVFGDWNACGTVWKPNLQPDFNVSVFECFDTSSSAGLRELDESDRSVQKSAESTSI